MCVQSRTSLAGTTVLVGWGAAVPALFVAADAAPAVLNTASDRTVAAIAILANHRDAWISGWCTGLHPFQSWLTGR